MRELARVLKPTGWAILQVPLETSRERTYEDFNIVAPQDRLRHFGQEDHVRVYGQDYRQRLEEAGFFVTIDPYVRRLGVEQIRRYGLPPEEDIYLCGKPA